MDFSYSLGISGLTSHSVQLLRSQQAACARTHRDTHIGLSGFQQACWSSAAPQQAKAAIYLVCNLYQEMLCC